MLIIETRNYTFVGPDNGVLSIAATRDGIRQALRIDERRAGLEGGFEDLRREGHLRPSGGANNDRRATQGPRQGDNGHGLTLSGTRSSGGEIVGEVLVIDSLGNIVTNIDGPSLRGVKFDQRIAIKVGGEGLRIPFVRTYGDVKKGAALALIGSSGMLEIGINQGSMSGRLSSAKEGTPVEVERMPR